MVASITMVQNHMNIVWSYCVLRSQNGKKQIDLIRFVYTYSAHMGNHEERMHFILSASKNILWWVKVKHLFLHTERNAGMH